MSKNKKTLVIICLLISFMFPITTSGMKKKSENTKTTAVEDSIMKELNTYKKIFLEYNKSYEMTNKDNDEEIKEWINKTEKKFEETEKKYNDFISNNKILYIKVSDYIEKDEEIIKLINTIKENLIKEKMYIYCKYFSEINIKDIDPELDEKSIKQIIDNKIKNLKIKEREFDSFFRENKEKNKNFTETFPHSIRSIREYIENAKKLLFKELNLEEMKEYKEKLSNLPENYKKELSNLLNYSKEEFNDLEIKNLRKYINTFYNEYIILYKKTQNKSKEIKKLDEEIHKIKNKINIFLDAKTIEGYKNTFSEYEKKFLNSGLELISLKTYDEESFKNLMKTYEKEIEDKKKEYKTFLEEIKKKYSKRERKIYLNLRKINKKIKNLIEKSKKNIEDYLKCKADYKTVIKLASLQRYFKDFNMKHENSIENRLNEKQKVIEEKYNSFIAEIEKKNENINILIEIYSLIKSCISIIKEKNSIGEKLNEKQNEIKEKYNSFIAKIKEKNENINILIKIYSLIINYISNIKEKNSIKEKLNKKQNKIEEEYYSFITEIGKQNNDVDLLIQNCTNDFFNRNNISNVLNKNKINIEQNEINEKEIKKYMLLIEEIEEKNKKINSTIKNYISKIYTNSSENKINIEQNEIEEKYNSFIEEIEKNHLYINRNYLDLEKLLEKLNEKIKKRHSKNKENYLILEKLKKEISLLIKKPKNYLIYKKNPDTIVKLKEFQNCYFKHSNTKNKDSDEDSIVKYNNSLEKEINDIYNIKDEDSIEEKECDSFIEEIKEKDEYLNIIIKIYSLIKDYILNIKDKDSIEENDYNLFIEKIEEKNKDINLLIKIYSLIKNDIPKIKDENFKENKINIKQDFIKEKYNNSFEEEISDIYNIENKNSAENKISFEYEDSIEKKYNSFIKEIKEKKEYLNLLIKIHSLIKDYIFNIKDKDPIEEKEKNYNLLIKKIEEKNEDIYSLIKNNISNTKDKNFIENKINIKSKNKNLLTKIYSLIKNSIPNTKDENFEENKINIKDEDSIEEKKYNSFIEEIKEKNEYLNLLIKIHSLIKYNISNTKDENFEKNKINIKDEDSIEEKEKEYNLFIEEIKEKNKDIYSLIKNDISNTKKQLDLKEMYSLKETLSKLLSDYKEEPLDSNKEKIYNNINITCRKFFSFFENNENYYKEYNKLEKEFRKIKTEVAKYINKKTLNEIKNYYSDIIEKDININLKKNKNIKDSINRRKRCVEGDFKQYEFIKNRYSDNIRDFEYFRKLNGEIQEKTKKYVEEELKKDKNCDFEDEVNKITNYLANGIKKFLEKYEKNYKFLKDNYFDDTGNFEGFGKLNEEIQDMMKILKENTIIFIDPQDYKIKYYVINSMIKYLDNFNQNIIDWLNNSINDKKNKFLKDTEEYKKYEEYKKSLKENYKNEEYFKLIEKIFNEYDDIIKNFIEEKTSNKTKDKFEKIKKETILDLVKETVNNMKIEIEKKEKDLNASTDIKKNDDIKSLDNKLDSLKTFLDELNKFEDFEKKIKENYKNEKFFKLIEKEFKEFNKNIEKIKNKFNLKYKKIKENMKIKELDQRIEELEEEQKIKPKIKEFKENLEKYEEFINTFSELEPEIVQQKLENYIKNLIKINNKDKTSTDEVKNLNFEDKDNIIAEKFNILIKLKYLYNEIIPSIKKYKEFIKNFKYDNEIIKELDYLISKFQARLFSTTKEIIEKIEKIFEKESANELTKQFNDDINKFKEEINKLETKKYEVEKEIIKFKEELKKCKEDIKKLYENKDENKIISLFNDINNITKKCREYIKKFNGKNDMVNEFESYLLITEVILFSDINYMIPENKTSQKENKDTEKINENDDSFDSLEKEIEEEINKNKNKTSDDSFDSLTSEDESSDSF